MVDLRDSMPDEAFYDLIHLLPGYRETFTAKLSLALDPLPATGR